MSYKRIAYLVILFMTMFHAVGYSQYFGENKVQYEDYDFKIYKTPHFSVYNYLDDSAALRTFGQLSEQWYRHHQKRLYDTLENNPIILYNNHADFQQTSVIQSLVSVGTGGVTEGLRNRVVLPLTPSNRETSHVLGHEMVHAFQYNMIKQNDSLSLQNMQNLPLWMVEGLAEYLSIGRRDNRTAMWMRDAVMSEDIPTFKQMTRNPRKYFPYRYGHAFWSFITGNWGEKMIKPMFLLTAKHGFKGAVDSLFNVSADSLSSIWQHQLKSTYKRFTGEKQTAKTGELIFDTKNAGALNLAPVMSPNGRYAVFISDRDVININYYVADIEKQKIIKKISSPLRKSHIDQFNFLESSGSWSPQGDKFVLSLFSKGKNILKILQIGKGEVSSLREIEIPELQAFKNPRWSPDGNKILFTGLNEGQSDLYIYNLKSKELRQLTNDRFSDLQPNWANSGDKIAFISERDEDTQLDNFKFGEYRITIYDLNTNTVNVLDVFPDADNFSPQFGPDDNTLYFISHADGYRNLYQYKFDTGKIFRLTRYATGITGLTDLSPTYSVAREKNKVIYSHYENKKYKIYLADNESFLKEEINPDELDQKASYLAPHPNFKLDHVVTDLTPSLDTVSDTDFRNLPYKAKFQLEHIGSSGIGFGTSQFGTAMAGGVSAIFGDMLNNHQLYSMLSVQGEIYDVAGQVAYINRSNRITWGSVVSHVPYRRSYGFFVPNDTLTVDEEQIIADNMVIMERRVFHDQVNTMAQYPLSRHVRIEGGAGVSRYSFRYDSINNYYVGYTKIEEDRHRLDAPDPFFMAQGHVALVGDNSDFGMTSPLNGHRYRVEVQSTIGKYDYFSVLADGRKYFFRKPVSFAVRGMHYGRYGNDADALYPMFLGQNYYIRGYSSGSLSNTNNINKNSISINQLIGSKLAVANAEIRVPFSGPKRLALIESKYVITDLVGFFDAGLVWQSDSKIRMRWEPSSDPAERSPMLSTGIGVRVNLFGYAIVQPYVAMPFQRENKDFVFGLGISGGGW